MADFSLNIDDGLTSVVITSLDENIVRSVDKHQHEASNPKPKITLETPSETPSIQNPDEPAMREEVTVTVQLVYDCKAERSKEQQTDDCEEDIGRLLDADSTTGVALTGYTVIRVQSEAETYGTTAECSAEFQADRAAEALKSLYTDAENNPAELLEYILCDLRHFADKSGLNFAAVDRKGYMLYAEECGGKS